MAANAQGSGGEVLLVGGSSGSLQDRFLEFKKEKQRERALARRSARGCGPTGGPRDVNRLRRRFVELCMGYIGVPYGRKHLEPDDPDIDAPLFLDCCGLVRQVCKDLQKDLGFRIGSWNQAYQFETLPIELTFEELKPGDLIFVEGTYYDETRRPQRHNIVHVEVFVGGDTGLATVGSRWSRSNAAEGKVRGVHFHPDYRYVSTKYEIHKYHFRSLDTWLQGTCVSSSYATPKQAANATGYCGGKSIFEAGEAASDREDEDCGFVPDPYRDAPSFYVGDGNNWKVIAEALESRGWLRLPFEAGFTCRFHLKWVEQRAKIDYRRHIEGQLVNHIPNNDVITAKMRFLDTMRAHEERTGREFRYHPSSYSSERAGEKLAAVAEAETAPDAIWILKPSRGLGGNGIELVKGAAALRERLFPPPRDLAEKGDGPPPPPREGWVIQRYVDRPLLLRGRKFDMRAYCLVARTTPHLWYFRPGYCKVALEQYSAVDLSSRYAHLTNACVQRTHPEYRESFRGQHIWSEDEAEAELISSGRWDPAQGPFWKKIHEGMRSTVAWLFEASRDLLERKKGYFDLLGLDFMMDAELNLHLLEVNSNPAMFFESSATLQELVPSLIGVSLDTVLAAQKPPADCDDSAAAVQTPAVPAPFQLVVDEAAGYVYEQ